MSDKTPQQLLDEFLNVRREGDGSGWAPFTEEDETLLIDLMYAIRDAKFAPDADGDRPLEFIIVNRTKQHRLHYLPVPYDDWRTGEGFSNAFNIAHMNAEIASGELSRYCRDVTERLRRQEAAKAEKHRRLGNAIALGKELNEKPES